MAALGRRCAGNALRQACKPTLRPSLRPNRRLSTESVSSGSGSGKKAYADVAPSPFQDPMGFLQHYTWSIGTTAVVGTIALYFMRNSKVHLE